MNHYNKVRATLSQMVNLRTAIDQLIKDCETELAKEPIDTTRTIDDLKLELELDELQEHFEKENKSTVVHKRVVIDGRKLENLRQQKIFDDREAIIRKMKQISPNKGE